MDILELYGFTIIKDSEGQIIYDDEEYEERNKFLESNPDFEIFAGPMKKTYQTDYSNENPIEEKIDSGEKSIGLRHVGKYNLIEVPSVKKRVFMTSDLSFLLDIRNIYNQLGIIKKEVS